MKVGLACQRIFKKSGERNIGKEKGGGGRRKERIWQSYQIDEFGDGSPPLAAMIWAGIFFRVLHFFC